MRTFKRMVSCLQHEPDYVTNTYIKAGQYLVGSVNVKLPHNPKYFYKEKGSDSFCLISGEIYNYFELSDKLTTYKISKTSGIDNDAELLFMLYRELGEDFLRDLNGWFSLFINDSREKKLILANDRFGMNPLYVYRDGKTFIFSPEVKAILEHHDMELSLDNESICDFIVLGCILDNKTFIKNIFRLPGSSKCVFSNGDCKISKYWNWDEYQHQPKLPETTFFEKSSEVFKKVIPRYFRHNSSTVLSLTGGIDTRTILSDLTPDLYPSITATYGWNKNNADNIVATKLSREYGIPHHFIYTTAEAFSLEFMNKMVFLCDGMANLNTFVLPFFFSDGFRQHYKNKIVVQGKLGTQLMHNARAPLDLKYNRVEERMSVLSPELKVHYVPKDVYKDNFLIGAIEAECRSYWFCNIAVENTMMVNRTPYFDNDLIALLFQRPNGFEMQKIQEHFIKSHSDALASIPTNRGLLLKNGNIHYRLLSLKLKLSWLLTFFGNSRHLPPLLQINRLPLPDNSILYPRALSSHIYYNRDVKEFILDKKTLGRDIFIPSKIKKMVRVHFHGWKDHRKEIARILILELFIRRFFE
jgi:hypothetical protein